MRRLVGRISGGKFISEEAPRVSLLKDMLDSRRGPSLNTDTKYFAGLGTDDPYAGLPENVRQHHWDKAIKAGINPEGKRYVGSLATEAGDPRALVESRGDMLRRAQEANINVEEGIITNKVDINADPRSTYEPADDLVEDRTLDILISDGAGDEVSVKEYEQAEEKAYNSLLR
jgi:hypothetical protein